MIFHQKKKKHGVCLLTLSTLQKTEKDVKSTGSTVGNFVCLNHKKPRRQMLLSNCLVLVFRVEVCGWVGALMDIFLMKNIYFYILEDVMCVLKEL